MGPAMGVPAPEGSGPRPAVVPGAEAHGVNDPSRGIRRQLAGLGYAAAVPGYYHGHGPAGTGNDDGPTAAIGHTGRLGFTCGARDLAGGGRRAAGHAEYRPSADCCPGLLRRRNSRLAGRVPPRRPGGGSAVPSGPAAIRGTESRRPVHPIDLPWQIACPASFPYGGRDRTYASGRLAGMRARISYRGVNAQAKMYPGAGRSLTRLRRPMRHAEANRAAWDDAISFLSGHMGA
jgi:dienelactone hydrolase